MNGFILNSGAKHFKKIPFYWSGGVLPLTGTRPPSEIIISHKQWNILGFFLCSWWNCFVSMLKYCTHKMRAFFQGIEIQEKRGGSTLNRRLRRSRPDSHSRLCKTKKDLNFFSYFCFIILSTLAVVWSYKQLETHRKCDFMWKYDDLLSPNLLPWWSLRHFCGL